MRVFDEQPTRFRRKGTFDFPAKRRREIALHAQYVGAADTEDFSRWLIAWVWHNTKARDQIWSVMQCARNIGRKITEAEASAITEEASITRKHLSADSLARFLGVTYAQRQALHLTTIGSVDVGRRARKDQRKRRDRLAHERRRREKGMHPQSQSRSATKPWEDLGMSRRTWERHRNKNDATLSTPIFLAGEDRLASPDRKRLSERGFASKKREEVVRLPTAATLAADIYATLPLELRLVALALS